MKFTAVFILALLALSVAAAKSGEAQRTGGSEDDFHENTDIQRTSSESSRRWEGTQQQRDLQAGEELLSETFSPDVIDQGVEVEEWVSRTLADGRVERVKVTKTIYVTKTTTIRTVRKFWNSTVNVDSVKPVILAFTDVYGRELNETQLNLFNYIAATDNQGAYEFNYNYVQVRQENLRKTLKAITDIFYTPLNQGDLNNLEIKIRTCENNEPIALNINTDAGESYNADGWLVRVEAFFATCANGKPGVQLASWAATKSGGWSEPENFSEPNVRTVDDIITQYLFRAMNLLFTCTDADIPVRPTHCSDPESSPETSAAGQPRRRRI